MERYFLSFEAPVGGDEPAAGRNLLSSVARGLRVAGVTLVEDVLPWDDYGWSVTLDAGGKPMWCMLQRSDEWLLICWTERSFFETLLGTPEPPEAATIRSCILEIVRSLSGSCSRWQTQREFHSGSTSS